MILHGDIFRCVWDGMVAETGRRDGRDASRPRMLHIPCFWADVEMWRRACWRLCSLLRQDHSRQLNLESFDHCFSLFV